MSAFSTFVRTHSTEIAIILLIAITRTFFFGYYFDDGFIYFRYIENLFQGNGLVFNTGEYVSSITSPLWVFVLIGVRALTSNLMVAATVLGIVLNSATAILLWKILKRYEVVGWIRNVALAFYIFDGYSILTNISGLETPLYSFLMVLAWYALDKSVSRVWLVLATSLIALTRLDGLLVVALVTIYLWVRKEYRNSFITVLLSGVVLTLTGYAYKLYYGSFIPHSILFKQAIEHYGGLGTSLKKIDAMLGFSTYEHFNLVHLPTLGIVASTMFVSIGLFTVLRMIYLLHLKGIWFGERNIMCAWLLGYTIFFAFSGAPSTYDWYYSATHATYILLFAVAASEFKWIQTLTVLKKQILIVLTLCFMVGNLFLAPYVYFRHALPGNLASVAASMWLEQNVKQNESVATSADGMLGCYAPHVRFLDMHGLVSDEVLQYKKGHGLTFNENSDSAKQEAEVISYFAPDYVVTGYGEDFLSDFNNINKTKLIYTPVEHFGQLLILQKNFGK